MDSGEIRKRFLEFFEKRGHKIAQSASLVPEGDPSVLFTTAGMQQFKPYFVGQADPIKDFGSKNTVSVQKCIRTSDIDEVGDDSHLTFFEMLGNFSFGEYLKEGAIKYAYEFITKELGLKIDYVTVFAGDSEVPKDEESEKIWGELGVKDVRLGERKDNFWGPTGAEGPCGPTTEIYINGIEIWNLVFNEYYCYPDKRLEKVSTPGVDTGMGLERLATVLQGKKNVFETDLFAELFQLLPEGVDERVKRIVIDHMKAVIFIVADGVTPSNKAQGYVLRRLLRRALAYAKANNFPAEGPKELIEKIIDLYKATYPELEEKRDLILKAIYDEREKFGKTLTQGLKELEKLKTIGAKEAFYLYETFGLPFDFIKDKAPGLKQEDFDNEFKKHQQISKTSAAGKFVGGLADNEPQTVKHHTAHHLLLAALKQVLGQDVKQRGSHINSGRLRMDFSFDRKLTPEEIKKVEDLVNQKISEGLEVARREMPRDEAVKIGAEMEFGAKYPEVVSVYQIGPSTSSGRAFSLEFCAGPHVKNTNELGHFEIIKEEAVAAGVRRIRARLE